MTIAQAFNEIAVAQGGTASKSGSITDAIDALNDALAGSDQAPAQTIEQAVRLLGENIGGGGGGGGFPVVEADADTGALSVTAGELVEMLGISPILVQFNETNVIKWFQILAVDTYTFKAISISGDNPEIMQWEAASADDYPTPYQG